jgi:hypothetical protein
MGKEQQEYLRVLFYTPSLLIRERAVDPERFSRMVSALARIEEAASKDAQKIAKSFSSLFDLNIKQIEIDEHLH